MILLHFNTHFVIKIVYSFYIKIYIKISVLRNSETIYFKLYKNGCVLNIVFFPLKC